MILTPLEMRFKDFMDVQKKTSVCKLCNEAVTGENATPSACQHAFHVQCLKSWTETKKLDGTCKCPIDTCTESFTAIFIRPSLGAPMKEAISLAVDNQCPVCFDDMTPPIASPECCNHYFCLKCLIDWSKVQHACPLDRKEYEMILVHDYIGGPVTERRPPPEIVSPIEPYIEDNTLCEVCHSPNDEANLLLCDNCDRGFHTYCLPVPLSEVPEGDWFCPECEPLMRDAEAELQEIELLDYRLGGLASDSAEESEGLENSAYDSDERENITFLDHVSNRSREILAREAFARHRGAGLLRDLIQNLENRARDEQRHRRSRTGQTRRTTRRRVRVEESTDDFLNHPELQNRSEPSSSVPPSEVGIHNSLFRRTRNEGGHRRYPARQIRPTRRLGAVEDSIDDFLNPPERNIQTESREEPSSSTGSRRLRRKRRRVLACDSSDSESSSGETEQSEVRPGPSNGQSPSRNAEAPHSTPRKRPRVLDDDESDDSDHISPIRPRRTPHDSEPPSKRRRRSTFSTEDSDEEEESPMTSSESDDDESSDYEPTEARSRDIFTSFSTDPNLSSIVDEIHDIASRRKRTRAKTNQSRKRKVAKRKTAKRRRRTTASANSSTGAASRLVKRARKTLNAGKSTTKKKRKTKKRKSTTRAKKTRRISTKKPRLTSTQRSIKQTISNATQPSSSIVVRSRRGESRVTTSSKLSIFGAEPTCGLVADLESNGVVNKQSTPVPSTPKSTFQSQSTTSPSTSSGFLSRLLAEQNALHRFDSFHMRVNPDKSISPLPISLPSKVQAESSKSREAPKPGPSNQPSTTENGVKASSSHQNDLSRPPNSLNGRGRTTEGAGCSGKSATESSVGLSEGPSSQLQNGLSVNGDKPSDHQRSGGKSRESDANSSQSSKENAAKRSPDDSSSAKQVAWTSDAVSRVRKVMEDHLLSIHSSTNEDTRKEIVKRAMGKVVRRSPERITDARVKTLVDQYVHFFRSNPLAQ